LVCRRRPSHRAGVAPALGGGGAAWTLPVAPPKDKRQGVSFVSVTTGTPFSVATWVRLPTSVSLCYTTLLYSCIEALHSPAICRLPIERQGRALRPQAELPFVCRAPKQLAEATAPLAVAASSLASPFVFRYGLGLSADTRSCRKAAKRTPAIWSVAWGNAWSADPFRVATIWRDGGTT
jgi:hypothetical protein